MQPENTQVKHVMNRHGVELAQLARNFGTSREDFVSFLKDKQRTGEFFGMLDNYNWFIKLQAEAEKVGGRVHLISNLVVDYSRPHNKAAMAGGPQTGPNSNVLKVDYKYEPLDRKKVTKTILLFNWPTPYGSYKKAVKWGLSNGLHKTTPHVPFAIGEQFPKLNYELGPNPMYVVETTGSTWGSDELACCVSWRDAWRQSNFAWHSNFDQGGGWIAFEK